MKALMRWFSNFGDEVYQREKVERESTNGLFLDFPLRVITVIYTQYQMSVVQVDAARI